MAQLLVVDDEPGVRNYLELLFRLAGHGVELAADADEAEAILVHGGIDIVILDVEMPGRSGLELLGSIDLDVAVVLHTGTEPEMPLRRPVAAVVVKPSDLDTVLTQVERLAERLPIAA